MSTSSMTPGSRPRKGLIAAAAVTVGVALAALAVVADDPTSPPRFAGAAQLVTFESCRDMATWAREADRGRSRDMTMSADMVEVSGSASGGAATEATAADQAPAAPAAPAATGNAADGEDATNVAVAGVDELDLVDRLSGDRVLVSSNGRLAIVDLAGARIVASQPVPHDAQVSYDAENAVAWVVGHDESRAGTSVARVAVAGDSLAVEGTWTTSGWLVDARRIDGELHLVATEGFGMVPMPEARPSSFDEPTGAAGATGLPFEGGPVPCDEVLRPVGPTDPVATLIVTLPATGAVEPVRAAEVVGAGEHVHVTPTAAYVSTPDYTGDQLVTGIHRFDLATLAPTGSGRVEGRLLNQFSLSESGGHLRVAVTTGSDVMVGMPVVEPSLDDPVADVAQPAPLEGEPRNEVVVLDIDGDLDVVGRTARFGKPGESIHGIRFVGEVAYAVTFLTTDPFYVIDLATPSAPQVVGEVELPGFSAYLHPLSDDLVVGFGPGEDGRATAKLFDVSDPTAPRVADSLVLGQESPVAWDHHAYVALGQDRFAVPAMDWSSSRARAAVVVVEVADGRLVEVDRPTVEADESPVRAIPAGDGWALLTWSRMVVLGEDGAVRATLDLI